MLLKKMNDLHNSVIVSGSGKFLTVSFDRPLNVTGKVVGLKSLTYPSVQVTRYVYRFRVQEDDTGTIHTFKW